MLKPNKLNLQQKCLVLILALGFLLRLAIAANTDGYVYDINCFFAWGMRMAEVGAADFYAADYFCDYPPAYLFVLGVVGHLMNAFRLSYLDKFAQILLVFTPALAEVGIAALLYWVALREGVASRWALRLAGFVAFCPMFWYDTAVWKQIDAVPALLLLGCFVLLGKARFIPAAALYGLALAIKPQALIVGPVLALCFLLPVFFAADAKAFWVAMKQGALSILAALAPLVLAATPFFGLANVLPSLYALYTTTASGYQYASVNAFNFIAACGGNWAAQDLPFTISLFGGQFALFFSWATFGKAAIVAVTAFVVLLALRARKLARFSPAFLAGVYMVGIFTFAHSMHERYLLLGVVLILCAVAQYGSAHLLLLAGGFSLTTLLNMAAVYTMVETDDAFFTSATSILVMRWVGLAETLLCLWLFYEAWQLCSGKKIVPIGAADADAPPPAQAEKSTTNKIVKKGDASARAKQGAAQNAPPAPKPPYTPAPQPKWGKAEIIFLSVLTAAVAVLSFCYLGDLTAPQSALDVRGDEDGDAEAIMVEGDVTSLWVYPGITESGANLTVYAMDGSVLLSEDLAIGDLFQWKSYDIAGESYYLISVSGVEMMELALKDADGNLCTVHGVVGELSALFDEQDLVPDTISQLNSFYFDEIYHARTGYESTQGYEIYEVSHPPMGKNFIALGILIFGMTGFGWRFAGVLFGVLLVPVIYWLTRRLTRSPLAAGLVALLLSFDFMRYTQSRIATIDTISAFFILLAATCMVWYCQRMLTDGVKKAILPMALSGLAFGFGAASKWTGLYAGVGLAILFFGVLALRYLQSMPKALATPSGGAAEQAKGTKKTAKATEVATTSKKAAARIAAARQAFGKEFALAIGGGVLFFVLIPLGIYIASYLPYFWASDAFTLSSIWQNQEYMLWYHATLDATHPFSSPWYTWFLDLRPVWYYMGSGLEAGKYASIAGFYNPILCWVGAAAWLRLCGKALRGRGDFIGSALIVLLLSGLLPWLLVTRCTFLYHYFPSFLFTLVAVGLWFSDLYKKDESRALALASGLLTLAIFFFVWFYPVLSGLPVGTLWAQTLKFLPSYGFYIIS